MARKFFIAVLLAAASLMLTQNAPAQAQGSGAAAARTSTQQPAPQPHDHDPMKTGESPPARNYFTDVVLVNQDGEKMRFYSDVLKGKTVVISAFFTTCTSVCPPMNRNLEKMQEALGERIGKDVFIVSISVDPETDTPERLKAYARKFHAKPGWIFLTGKKENVDWALYKVGQYIEEKNDHTTGLIIGNEATGLWKKAFGLTKTAELVELVQSFVNDKGAAAQ
jgi:protein SCO1/2